PIYSTAVVSRRAGGKEEKRRKPFDRKGLFSGPGLWQGCGGIVRRLWKTGGREISAGGPQASWALFPQLFRPAYLLKCASYLATVRSNSGSDSRVCLILSTEYITVEWCLSLNSLPISG